MKRAIMKAIENGFDIKKHSLHARKDSKLIDIYYYGTSIEFEFQEAERFPYSRTYHHSVLIFSTDFIDKLVGEGELSILCMMPGEVLGGGYCIDNKCSYGRNSKICEERVEYYSNTPNAHKQKLAIMTNEERIEYINKLAEE